MVVSSTRMRQTGTGSNTYRVVVQASDGGVESHANWFKVTVNVTDEARGRSNS